MIYSILDTDLYKLTMQQAVIQKFPNTHVKYTFINRGDHEFTKGMVKAAQTAIDGMANLYLTNEEKEWLGKYPYFSDAYIQYLSGYRFDPKEVTLKLSNGKVSLDIEGPWHRTILWEVPLMAIMSEAFHYGNGDLKNYDISIEAGKIKKKGLELEDIGAPFSEFGTRRRFIRDHQRMVLFQLKQNCPKTLKGTSNVWLARELNLNPVGTQAHEWFMFHGAVYGYLAANEIAMNNWVDVYNGDLGIALSDTFTTDEFFRVFDKKMAKLYDGLRQDSGDPLSFLLRTNNHYRSIGVDPKQKTVIFSDSLNLDLIARLSKATKEADGVNCAFGIGTHLTCNVDDVTPMNMVIKMTACKLNGKNDRDWLDCVKLSDSPGKYTGDSKAIKKCLLIIKG